MWDLPTATLVALSLICLGLLAGARPRLGGTTLVAPWVWSCLAIAALAGVELVWGRSGGGWAEPARYAAAMATFCPTMAVLGAKRPQDRGWQWVVLALWLTLAIPSGQWLVFQPGGDFTVFTAWNLFTALLVGLGLANYLPTRHWPSAVLVAAGQVALLSSQWFEVGASWLPWLTTIAMGCFTLALGLASRRRSPRPASGPAQLAPLDASWLAFRDAYGASWALRVRELVNQTARVSGWPVRLEWGGYVRTAPNANAPDETVDPAAPLPVEQIRQSLRTVLRRFVSGDWLQT